MTINNIERQVPLGTGPPTRQELEIYYPPRFTWHQLKTFINSGDLGLLKRDKGLQERYNRWAVGVRKEYGSMVNYLLKHRLRWGEPDRLSVLPSKLDDRIFYAPQCIGNASGNTDTNSQESLRTTKSPGAQADVVTAPISDKDSTFLPPLPADAPEYFKADIPPEYICKIQNDWPYSVPAEIEHSLVWTRIPIMHPAVIPPQVTARVHQDGLWGFTGYSPNSPPPSPSTLHEHLPALAEWEVTMDKLIRSQRGPEEEEVMVRRAGEEVDKFVKMRWNEREWETAWFVNPPRLQSVPGLAHIHVFARYKSVEEIANGL